MVAGSGPVEVNEYFFNYLILLAALCPWGHSVSNRNTSKYQEHESNVSGEQSAAGALGCEPSRHL
jgi:hypothetical protein